MKNTANRSSLFLIELIFNLLIFAVCTSVCAGLLIKAYSMSNSSTELTNAVYAAQTTAEEWQAGLLNTQEWHAISSFDDLEIDSPTDNCTVSAKFVDRQGLTLLTQTEQTTNHNAAFTVLLYEETMKNNLQTAHIQIYRKYFDKELYSLTISRVGGISAT